MPPRKPLTRGDNKRQKEVAKKIRDEQGDLYPGNSVRAPLEISSDSEPSPYEGFITEDPQEDSPPVSARRTVSYEEDWKNQILDKDYLTFLSTCNEEHELSNDMEDKSVSSSDSNRTATSKWLLHEMGKKFTAREESSKTRKGKEKK